jgi:hypothetical protein
MKIGDTEIIASGNVPLDSAVGRVVERAEQLGLTQRLADNMEMFCKLHTTFHETGAVDAEKLRACQEFIRGLAEAMQQYMIEDYRKQGYRLVKTDS